MEVTKDSVVQFHYVLRNDLGEEIESTEGGDPVAYLHGYNNVIVGLEEAFQGKTAGDSFSVTLEPEKAYGPRQDMASQRVPIKHLRGAKKWKPGMVAWVQTKQGNRQVTLIKVGKFNADCDFNHPLAGKTLTFDVSVIDVREATAEEKSHGHAHGVGGHHH